MNTPPPSRPEVLFVDSSPLPQELLGSMRREAIPVHAVRDEEEALQRLRDPGLDQAVIVANHHLLRRMSTALSHHDLLRHGHLVRVLITDGRESKADFAAINETPVFRVLEKPLDPGATSQHLRDAMGLHTRQCLGLARMGDGGTGLRDALAFLAHEINTPLALIQGYIQALTQRLGVFAAMPAPKGAVKSALDATERNARHCQSLVTWIAQTARSACADREHRPGAASERLQTLLDSYPFAGEQRSLLSIDVEHDFPLPSRAGLVPLLLFTLTRTALNALHGVAQPRLRITLDLHEGTHCIRFSHNGKRPPAEVLDALTSCRSSGSGSPGTDLVFCQRVMRSMHGELQIALRPDGEIITLLRFGPVKDAALQPLRGKKGQHADSIDPRKRDLALRLSP